MEIHNLAWLIVIALGIVGAMRGIRSEAITLAGVIGAGVVFSTDDLRSRVVVFLNRLPDTLSHLVAPEGAVRVLNDGSTGIISTPDQRLFFYLALFAITVGMFYFAGTRWGSPAFSRVDRIIGGIMGGLSGFVISVTLFNFSADYQSRNGALPGIALELPTIVSPSMPTENVLAQYTSVVFIGAMMIIGLIVVLSVVRR